MTKQLFTWNIFLKKHNVLINIINYLLPDEIRQIAARRPISVESAFNGWSDMAKANIYENIKIILEQNI